MKDQTVSESRFIPADAATIFAVIDNPAKHLLIDGSGSVTASRTTDRHLTLGDRFGMDMRIGLPYRMTNQIVEYEKDRLIAWAHFGKHRWRYELGPTAGGTTVTETFDWSTAKAPRMIELMGYPARNAKAIEATLARLAAHVET